MEYGTGAIMSVPAHDERDFAFATKYGLPIRVVIAGPGMGPDTVLAEAYSGPGVVVNSGTFSGLPSEESKAKMGLFAEERGFGDRKVRYRLRDWLISRQRLLGHPDPRWCTAKTTASCRCPTAGSRWCCRRTSSSAAAGEPARAGAPRSRRSPARNAASRRAGKPTPWTRSWTRRGTTRGSSTRTSTTR